jgi:signal transduction histidine kinase
MSTWPNQPRDPRPKENPQEGRPTTGEIRPRDEQGRELEALRASRARIAAMANGQRREIERRLHDGIQQDLVALAVHLQLAEEAIASDPAALGRLLGEMRQDVHDALEDVRTLARGVYPPLLTDLGLTAALGSLGAAPNVRVEAEAAADRYPEDVEAAVYFSFLEAVEAIRAGGPGAGARLRVWRDGESVLFEVSLEGWRPSGSQADSRTETVLDRVATAISDRVGALGGALTVMAEGDQASLRGAIPLGEGPTVATGDPRPGTGSPP